MELNREQIIKALMLHSQMEMPCFRECPYGKLHYCGAEMAKDALALIKELTKKIDDLEYRLEVQGDNLGATSEWLNYAECKVEKLTEENERLRAENESYAELEQGCYVTGYKKIKAATVREFAERLKEKLVYFTDEFRYFAYAEIDQIAKEMTEG